jgi:hypothetical protein
VSGDRQDIEAAPGVPPRGFQHVEQQHAGAN